MPDPLAKQAFKLVKAELDRATVTHGVFPTIQHGYGVIKEEFREFEDEVFRREVDRDALVEEATQLAAMAIRFLIDVAL